LHGGFARGYTHVMSKATWLAAVLVVVLAGCAVHATQAQLVNRAAFDLNCDAAAISIVEIDELTRGARGCGRQATYVEVCDGPKYGNSSNNTKCTWVMNTTNDGTPAPAP
jgi:hypothetical protein